MSPDRSAPAIAETMRLLDEAAALREATAVGLECWYRHAVVKGGGEGPFAAAMRLEAARHLWNARVDPRRRTYGSGLYAHVLAQWGIIDDQPLVFHPRQAGAAIEGIGRQTAAATVERLVLDTHGDPAVGLAIR